MLLNTVLGEIIDVVQAFSMSMNRLPFMEVATELPISMDFAYCFYLLICRLQDAYPSLLIKHVLNCFKEKESPEEADGFYRLDGKSISRQLAIRIFLEHPVIYCMIPDRFLSLTNLWMSSREFRITNFWKNGRWNFQECYKPMHLI